MNPMELALKIKARSERYKYDLSEAADTLGEMMTNIDIGFYLMGVPSPVKSEKFLRETMKTLIAICGEEEVKTALKKETK